MPDSEAKEDKRKELDIDKYLEEIMEKLETDRDGFMRRLGKMKEDVFSYQFHPQHFNIVADAFLTFFVMSQDMQKEYLAGTLKEKMNIILNIRELEDPKEIMERAMYITEILLYNASINQDSIYSTAANKILYALTGSDELLTEVGLSYYKMPRVARKREDPEGMYH